MLSSIFSIALLWFEPYCGAFSEFTQAIFRENELVGIPFCIVPGLSNNVSCTKVHLVLAILSNIASVYLAGVLIILRDFCVVCVLTYVVNAVNFLLVYQKMQQQTQGFQKKKE